MPFLAATEAVFAMSLEQCLSYFREAIERPGSVPPWADWWTVNQESVRQAFDHEDYLRLKFRRLDAARGILQRRAIAFDEPNIGRFERTHCPHCGERLMKFIPGAPLSREEVVAFGRRAGIEQCIQGFWLHYGVYCPLGCICELWEFRKPP